MRLQTQWVVWLHSEVLQVTKKFEFIFKSKMKDFKAKGLCDLINLLKTFTFTA